jgi:hypothetical protein
MKTSENLSFELTNMFEIEELNPENELDFEESKGSEEPEVFDFLKDLESFFDFKNSMPKGKTPKVIDKGRVVKPQVLTEPKPMGLMYRFKVMDCACGISNTYLSQRFIKYLIGTAVVYKPEKELTETMQKLLAENLSTEEYVNEQVLACPICSLENFDV